MENYTIVVEYGDAVELVEPTRDGCDFLGWYYNDELFDDKPKKSITERLAEIEIYEPSKELSENLKKIGEQMANEIASKEAYNYGSKLNEKYSVLDKEDGEKIEDWEEFREIEDDEQEYEEDLDELMDFISEVFDDR